MRFATTLDGQPLLVARDRQRATPIDDLAPSLLAVLQQWPALQPRLAARAAALEAGATDPQSFCSADCAAPLPQAPQWLDGSAFLHHGRLLERAFGNPPIPDFDTVPLLYQGASDDFLGPGMDVPLPSEDDGIDVEGEFGVVVDDVPMGVTPEEALGHVRLLVLINDWSLRRFGPREMKAGFGFIQAKPSTAFAPLAVTPDELGPAWHGGRVHLDLHVHCRGEHLGQPSGSAMDFHFGTLIAHAARTRRLRAGSIVGSGTVSNDDLAAGSACLAERRVLEMLQTGAAHTPFLRFGDRVQLEARHADGRPGPFGRIDQRVVGASVPNQPRAFASASRGSR